MLDFLCLEMSGYINDGRIFRLSLAEAVRITQHLDIVGGPKQEPPGVMQSDIPVGAVLAAPTVTPSQKPVC